MSAVQMRVREAVQAVQVWLAHTPAPGEAVVRQAIVLRLLHAAGFDIWNPAEVVPEETNSSGNRSDFLIRLGTGKFALELKGMNVALSPRDYQQVVTYAASEGTPWAVLTNGRVWVILDRTHNPGGTFQEHEVLKLELGQEGDTFADDFAALFDPAVWKVDAFAQAVGNVRARQERRLNEARIRRQKTAVIEDIQEQFQIPSFDLAAQAAVEMNRMTEAERDVLLGHSRHATSPTTLTATLTDSTTEVFQAPIRFHYRVKGAHATALYDPSQGTWTLMAGSTALNRVCSDPAQARALKKRREVQKASGQLEEVDATYLRFLSDVPYTSPSVPALDISGGPKNGWDVWRDDEGRPAQFYRPTPSPCG
ncbi:DUF4357 domain-containing protein [Deinococcus multiflagellatus]|uniref:DUF4357 domain-containing protein n=1 Tax=Deinococcus multiflagellatus TaxID=1656887 RepID=A0ABW1ZLD0_9DEIO|nr:DUF4357 domain-containing protein [Deinococcus multiflagellatus]MBZ9712336.1 DUF4357 domain-containing protein [Deinococcus multiflagellatus]